MSESKESYLDLEPVKNHKHLLFELMSNHLVSYVFALSKNDFARNMLKGLVQSSFRRLGWGEKPFKPMGVIREYMIEEIQKNLEEGKYTSNELVKTAIDYVRELRDDLDLCTEEELSLQWDEYVDELEWICHNTYNRESNNQSILFPQYFNPVEAILVLSLYPDRFSKEEIELLIPFFEKCTADWYGIDWHLLEFALKIKSTELSGQSSDINEHVYDVRVNVSSVQIGGGYEKVQSIIRNLNSHGIESNVTTGGIWILLNQQNVRGAVWILLGSGVDEVNTVATSLEEHFSSGRVKLMDLLDMLDRIE